MHRYIDSHLRTKFDVYENTIVFTTSKTLNERFTQHHTRRAFVLNNGYTALYKDNYITGRVAFQNRRSIDFHKRFSLYQRGDLALIENQVFGNENKSCFKSRLAEIGSKRRKVLNARELYDDEPTKYCNEESLKSIVQSSDYYNNNSSDYISVNTPRNSRSSKFLDTDQSSGSKDKVKKNSSSFDEGPVKRTWDGRVKGKDDSHLKDDSGGSEPIIYSPFPSYRNNHYIRPSLYKWRRGPPTKEQLDEELDRFMAEAKYNAAPASPVKEDIDSFIMEYMFEIEKCLNENADINIE